MRPLRLKASGSPITSANYEGLQELSDSQINQYLSYVITNKFANDTNGTGTAELNSATNNGSSGTSIGTFVDTITVDGIGTHPTAGSISSQTYYFKQVTSAAAESITNRVVGYSSGITELTDGNINTEILDKVINDMVDGTTYTVGQYSLKPTAPSGGTWTSRYTITNSKHGGNNNTYLWQKTAPTDAANADLTTLKVFTGGVKAMTSAEIEQMVPNFRNRIISTAIGTYKVQATTPVETGTWVQMGDQFDDTRENVSGTSYAGTYAGTFGANFSGSYIGPKTYTGAYTGTFSGIYTGNFVGTGAYTGTYSGNYTGNYVAYYGGYAGPSYAGTYAGSFVGFFSGPKTYSGNYTGAFNQVFSGNFIGTSAYAGTYSGVYSGNYTGNYTGDTVQVGTSIISSIKLWLRTA